MSKFLLVDLAAQSNEVVEHVKGWKESVFLDWLKQFG